MKYFNEFGNNYPSRDELPMEIIEHHAEACQLAVSDNLIWFAESIWAECNRTLSERSTTVRRVFLCKWGNNAHESGGWGRVSLEEMRFFSDENGYDDEYRHIINMLQVGETADLSDGINPYHNIERLI